MTVNIGLVTSDALVFGCDSVASTSGPFIDPFSLTWDKDESGKLVRDAEGRFSLHFSATDIQTIVTNAWGGVTKMFEVHPHPSPVVAVTSGLAKLNERTIATHANEFFATYRSRKPQLVDIETICKHFLRFMRTRYQKHYSDSGYPEEFREGPTFLVGGFGRDDAFPSLYRVSVQHNTSKAEFAGGKTGISWNGQSDAVERFIRGYDTNVMAHVNDRITTDIGAHAVAVQVYVTELVNRILDELKAQMPEGVEVKLPALGSIPMNLDQFALPIDYANLPLQEAVYFVSAMVMSQASRSRFAPGVATVGGRTHVGVVTKADGFKALNEPTLAHPYTGFSDDL